MNAGAVLSAYSASVRASPPGVGPATYLLTCRPGAIVARGGVPARSRHAGSDDLCVNGPAFSVCAFLVSRLFAARGDCVEAVVAAASSRVLEDEK